jgi:hypothetical protein
MSVTPYPDVNELLNQLLAHLQDILGAKLVGLYLYGSLVSGDFDPGLSDVDLLAVLSSELTGEAFERLHEMQNGLVAARPQWDDRIEIAYLPAMALKTFRTETSPIAIISPGEPFHIKDAGREWLINWYLVREQGVALFGPSPKTLIDPIPKEEYIRTVQEHTKAWAEWLHDAHTRKSQAYAILTFCRALYAYRHGEQVSKRRAARWTARAFPQWSSLVEQALWWREAPHDEDVAQEVVFAETLPFLRFVREQVGV